MKKTAQLYRGLVFCFVAGCLTGGSFTAKADVLYNNGPVNGNYYGWDIADDGNNQVVANSFVLNSSSLISTIDFSVWTDGNGVSSMDWAIVTNPFDPTAIVASATAGVTGTLDSALSPNSYAQNIYAETLNTGGVALAAGTYWLEFSDAVQSGANPGDSVVFWDENDGPSAAVDSFYGSQANFLCDGNCGLSGSETFAINGVSTPEPGTVALLLGGLLVTAGRAVSTRRSGPLGRR